MFEGHRLRRQGPPQEPARRRGADARAGARRGRTSPSWPARSTSTRCGPRSSSRCPPSASSTASAGERVGRPPRPRLPRRRLRRARASCCGSARRCATGSRATGSRSTATTSTTRTPAAHDDSMLAANQRIWGFETNFGGLAELAVVKANQLMPKPAHLTWEEAAVNALCNSTSYRMLVGAARRPHEAGRRRAHLGRHRRHRRLRRRSTCSTAAASPSAWCRRPSKAALLHDLGVRGRDRPQGRRLPLLDRRRTPRTRASGAASARTSAASSATTPTSCSSTRAARPWARRCSCASGAARSSPAPPRRGYMVEFDNRHFWMKLKRLIASHFANYHEAWAANRLISQGRIQPILSAVYPLEETGEAARRGPPQPARGQDRRAVPGAGARASASTTPSAGPRSARTRSRCSVATVLDGRADRDRPRRHRRQRPRGGHRLLPAGVRRRRSTTARSSSATASRRRC